MNSINKNTTYFKITNKKEKHNGFQYKDGLNVLIEPFSAYGSCVRGGLYFTTAKYILRFADYGIYLREVTLPLDDPDFKFVADISGDKWRANKIIFGKRRDLFDPETFKYLISLGADPLESGTRTSLLFSACANNSIEIMRILFQGQSIGQDVKNRLFYSACGEGHMEIIKFLLETGVDLKTDDSHYIYAVAERGQLDVVKFLVEKGINYRNGEDKVMLAALRENHKDVIDFFLEKDIRILNNFKIMETILWKSTDFATVKKWIEAGIDPQIHNNFLIISAATAGELELAKYLVECGIDCSAQKNLAFSRALEFKKSNILEYLMSLPNLILQDDDDDVRSLIIQAIRRNNLKLVKFIVERGVCHRFKHNLPLRIAIEMGHDDIAVYLFNQSYGMTSTS